MKHDLIAAEIQAGDLKKELEEKRIELNMCAARGRTALALIRQIRIWKIY